MVRVFFLLGLRLCSVEDDDQPLDAIGQSFSLFR